MAQGALFVGWGPVPVRGREQKAVEVFNESMQYYAQLQQQGEIESFEPVLLEPHGGDLGGFILIKGDQDKLNHLRFSDEFRRMINRGAAVIDEIGVVSAYVGDELNRFMQNYLPDVQDVIS
jgi:hypothetical protein